MGSLCGYTLRTFLDARYVRPSSCRRHICKSTSTCQQTKQFYELHRRGRALHGRSDIGSLILIGRRPVLSPLKQDQTVVVHSQENNTMFCQIQNKRSIVVSKESDRSRSCRMRNENDLNEPASSNHNLAMRLYSSISRLSTWAYFSLGRAAS